MRKIQLTQLKVSQWQSIQMHRIFQKIDSQEILQQPDSSLMIKIPILQQNSIYDYSLNLTILNLEVHYPQLIYIKIQHKKIQLTLEKENIYSYTYQNTFPSYSLTDKFYVCSAYIEGSIKNNNELDPPKIISNTKQIQLLKCPKTNVVKRLPKICDDIINPQNNPKSSLFLYQLATSLVYAPWATQRIDAPTPHIIAPAHTIIQTKTQGNPSYNTITKPVAQNIAQDIALKNIDFLYPRALTIKDENKEVIPNTPQMHIIAVCPILQQ